MKIKIYFLIILAAISVNGISQTLYVPSGTSGIGSSSNANVGIGLSSPTQKLEVNGRIKANNAIIGRSAWSGYAWFTNSNTATTGGYALLQQDNGTTYLNAADTKPIHFRINNVTKMYLAAGGDIGIGTTSPAYKLDVRGGISNGSADFVLGKYDGRPQGSKTRNRAFVHAGWNTSADELIINYDGDFEAGVRIMGTQTLIHGNVGIGKMATGYRLAVAGSMIAEEIMTKLQSSWPDYVFENSYDLMDLMDLKKFVKENNHLPEVPAANEIKDKGLNLGEMDAILLKKIEELTLYVISLKEENLKLQERIKKLEK